MLKIKPPTHKIDGGGVYIADADAWDHERIDSELEQLIAAALAEVQDKAAEAHLAANAKASDAEVAAVRESCVLTDEEKAAAVKRHPVVRYRTGRTRFQPDAPDHDPSGKPITAREYLLKPPTEFAIRRLSYQEYHRASEETSTFRRLVGFARKGLRAIRSPDALQWELRKGDDEAPDEIMQALHEAGPLLVREIGAAVVLYNAPLSDDESFR